MSKSFSFAHFWGILVQIVSQLRKKTESGIDPKFIKSKKKESGWKAGIFGEEIAVFLEKLFLP